MIHKKVSEQLLLIKFQIAKPYFVCLLTVTAAAISGQPFDGDGKRLGVGHRHVPRRVRSCHFDAGRVRKW